MDTILNEAPPSVREFEEMREMLIAGKVHYPPNGWWEDLLFYLQNNHVLLSAFCAHPAHPYTRCRRSLVLLSSVTFAFFLNAVFIAAVQTTLLRSILEATIGTIVQMMWDVPSGMVGACTCANASCLPSCVVRLCHCVSCAILACHLYLGILYGIVGVVILALEKSERTEVDEVSLEFAHAKVLAWATSVPFLALIFGCSRYFEKRKSAKDVVAHWQKSAKAPVDLD